ncbi:mitochondrial ribosomal protein subunit L20-domain-containing protein [Diplogelasinospora grovesii]|uniref:Mitochondrial ribosomal protein subunit L20-domain-containing protein n=1 Tax=Diplogelasinospora grovesii TaxID=303347 RepID=A0AAN6NE52_9PEZI|nr:mitochondrial ribosomal protein subunit L20-domain-containing protein [Diplogelasinospora grovesii]
MEAQLLRRPAASCKCLLKPSSSTTSASLPITAIRTKLTASRHRRALNVPPHPSMLLTPSSSADHILFNPPSSAPSVYHTPFKFLPKSDPRRRANLPSLFASSTTINYNPDSTSSSSSTTDLPPVVLEAELKQKTHHLTKEDVEEMRRLREQDPVANTVQNLANKFRCSKLFVMMCCQAPREYRDQKQAQMEAIKNRWGPRRSAAREDRKRRLDMLFRGEL